MDGEPFKDHEAKRRIKGILANPAGIVQYSSHAKDQMKTRTLERADILNILRGGKVEPPEEKDGKWAYRVRTNTMYVVIAFLSEHEMRVVTAWRKDP